MLASLHLLGVSCNEWKCEKGKELDPLPTLLREGSASSGGVILLSGSTEWDPPALSRGNEPLLSCGVECVEPPVSSSGNKPA